MMHEVDRKAIRVFLEIVKLIATALLGYFGGGVLTSCSVLM